MTLIRFGLAAAISTLAAGDALAFGRGGGGRPAGGAAPRPAAVSAYGGGGQHTTAAGGQVQSGSRSGSYTTNRGTTVNYAGAGYGGTTAGGTQYGRGVGGVQVTGAGGQTYSSVGRAGGAQGPGGYAVGGRSGVAATTGPRGTASTAYRGGAAVGPGGAVAGGSRVSAGTSASGNWATAYHGGAAMGAYGGVAAGRGGAVVAGSGGAVAAKHSTFYASQGAVVAHGAAVRGGYAYHAAYFNPTWYTAHPAAWTAARLTAAAVWAAPTYATVAAYSGAAAQPVTYDYGSTIVYQGDDVYVDGTKLATADQYAAQATAIADAGRQAAPPADDEWQPLGVFGLVQGEQAVADNLFQLAANKAGVLRGNYYDALADSNLAVYGSVDPKTQRAAWSVGEKKDIVYEAGLYNLTQPQCSVLIHYGKERTRQMMLVRLEEPKDAK